MRPPSRRSSTAPLLVVEEGETRVNEVRCSLDCLRATNVLGVVLNRSVHLNRDGKAIFA